MFARSEYPGQCLPRPREIFSFPFASLQEGFGARGCLEERGGREPLVGWSDWWVCRPTYSLLAPVDPTSPPPFWSRWNPESFLPFCSGRWRDPHSVRRAVPAWISGCRSSQPGGTSPAPARRLPHAGRGRHHCTDCSSRRPIASSWATVSRFLSHPSEWCLASTAVTRTGATDVPPLNSRWKGARNEYGLQNIGSQASPATNLTWLVRKTVPDQVTLVGQK